VETALRGEGRLDGLISEMCQSGRGGDAGSELVGQLDEPPEPLAEQGLGDRFLIVAPPIDGPSRDIDGHFERVVAESRPGRGRSDRRRELVASVDHGLVEEAIPRLGEGMDETFLHRVQPVAELGEGVLGASRGLLDQGDAQAGLLDRA
jgi:hypothetical protein